MTPKSYANLAIDTETYTEFKRICDLYGYKYNRRVEQLMREWIKEQHNIFIN